MMRFMIVAAVGVSLAAFLTAEERKPEKKAPMIGHMVYFKLKDGSAESRKKFVDSCNKYLANHEGAILYSAGTLGDEFKGQANDRDWDIALHVVFVDKAAHDKYQVHPDHKKFVSENKDAMEKVRVFDSELADVKVKAAR